MKARLKHGFVRFLWCLTLLLCSASASLAADGDLEFHPLEAGTLTSILPDAGELDFLLIGEIPHYTAELPRILSDRVLPELSAAGYRVYAAEMGHAHGLIVDAYVNGRLSRSDTPWTALLLNGDLFDAIRDHNANSTCSLAVRGVDLNHFPWAFGQAIRLLPFPPEFRRLAEDAVRRQFGGNNPPSLPLPPFNRQLFLEALYDWLRLGDNFRAEYLAELEEALSSVQSAPLERFDPVETDQLRLLERLIATELESVNYWYNHRAAQRERVMAELSREVLRAFGSPVVIHVGVSHAERTDSPVTDSMLAGSRLGTVLAREFSTYHLFAYGLSGVRIENFLQGRRIAFDHRGIYPDGNLVTELGRVAADLGIVTIAPNAANRNWPFGIHVVQPSRHWDAFMILPEVTIHPYLQ